MKVDYIKPQAECLSSGIYEFTKTVTLDKTETYKINIYTSGRYILTINGEYVCEGPCKGHEYVRYYDTVETNALKAGENEIKITVLHMNDGFNFSTVYQTVFPVIIFEATSATNLIVTDASWKCQKNTGYSFAFPGYRFLPPFETLDYSKGYEEYPVFCDEGFDFSKGIETIVGVVFGEAISKRPIPMIFPDEDIEFKVVKSGDNFIELDAGIYTTARVAFEFAAKVDAKITYSECYEFPDGKRVRDDISGEIKGFYDAIKTTEATTYEPFWFRAFRFIRIEAENIKDAFVSARAKFWHYPIELDGSFECSDEYLNKMYNISLNTMLCCTHETFYDCPYYEQQQYDMDAAIESSVLMRMTHDKRMVRKCIEEFAASQQASGLLLANYPSIYRQIIPGFSFFWIFLLHDYMTYSKDVAFAKSYIGTVDRILEYFDLNLSPDGLILTSNYWDYVDWVPQWDGGMPIVKDGEPITVYNMYYAYALLCAEDICRKCGRNGLAGEYRERYNVLSKAIKNHCYDENTGLYTDSRVGSDYSTHTIMWAIISELEADENARELMKHLNDKDIKKASFSMNYYLFRALEKCGMAEEIFNNLDGWKKMIDLHCTTWCENPDSPRSECHGWSSAPLYEFSANLLGVKVGFDDEIIISPVTAGLSYAKGTTPTRFGNVDVSWENADKFTIKITAPEGVTKRVILPNGVEKTFTGSQIELLKKDAE